MLLTQTQMLQKWLKTKAKQMKNYYNRTNTLNIVQQGCPTFLLVRVTFTGEKLLRATCIFTKIKLQIIASLLYKIGAHFGQNFGNLSQKVVEDQRKKFTMRKSTAQKDLAGHTKQLRGQNVGCRRRVWQPCCTVYCTVHLRTVTA